MIDVLAAGVTGDGVTDDAAALQALLDQPGDYLLPADGGPRTYQVAATPLRLREHTRLTLAPGATLRRAAGSGLLRNRWDGDNYPGYTGRGNIAIEGGGTLDMAGEQSGITASAASAITLCHADNLRIRDITILNVPGAHGIDLMGCRNVRIEGVTFSGYLADPADGQPREAIQVDGTYGAYGGDGYPFDSTYCDDVTVTHCRFQASEQLPAPQRGVGSHGFLADVAGHEHRHINVVANTLVGVTDRGVNAWCWTESRIDGNIISDPAQNGIAIRQNCWHLDVVHNDIYDAGTSGIWANGGGNNLVLHGNVIVGSGRAAHNTHYGICVEASCKILDITANRIRMRSGGNNARYGLYISGSCSGVYRHGNRLSSSGVTGPLLDNSAAPITSAADAL